MIGSLSQVLGPEHRRELRLLLAADVAAAVIQGIAFALLVPLLTALLGDDPGDAWPWVLAMAGACALYAVATYTATTGGYHLGSVLCRTLQHRIGDHVARLPLGWFTGARTGGLSRLTSEGVMSIMQVPAHLLRPLLAAFVTPAVVALTMFLFDWRMAVAALVTIPLLALTYRWSGDLITRTDKVTDAAAAETSARVIEFARAQPVLRSSGRTAEEHWLLDDALLAQRATARRQITTAVPGVIVNAFAIQAAFTVLLMTGVVLALGGSLGAPKLLALLVLAVRFTEPMLEAGLKGAALRLGRGNLGRIQDVLATPPLAEPSHPHRAKGADVEFDDVTFSYGDGDPVLRGLSLRIPPRSMTALVGPSGAGKTTVIRLIARFFDVQSGQVRVGGADVREQATEDLMAQLSLVFQDVYLFDGTIEDNVRIARESASPEEVRRAGTLAGVDEIAARLPDGWGTRVGEGGARLSGGERQRISIARAILKDAPIVLLDEATAALDPENETVIQSALSTLARDKTLLVIAHRLRTVVAADQIAVLDSGKVAETGTHEELLAAGGRYADFWAQRERAAGWRIR